jgi:hypothetical protein
LSRRTFQNYGSQERVDEICANAPVPEEVTRHARHPKFGPSVTGRGTRELTH